MIQEKHAVCDLSIVIPVKDRVDVLIETVESIYAQTVLPQEIVIIDDGSSVPLTLDMLPNPPASLPIRIFRNDSNKGGPFSLNKGASKTLSEFIAFLDSDDCLLPDYLEKVSARWQKAEINDVALITGFFWCTNDLVPYKTQSVLAPITHEALLGKGNFVGGTSVMSVRKESFLSVGGHPIVGGSHDWGLLIRLSGAGNINILSEPLVLYRSPSTNPLPTYTKSYRKQINAMFALYKLQSLADRRVMRLRIKKYILNNLARWGRRRMALRLIFSIIFKDRVLDSEIIKTFAIIALGGRMYDRTLLQYALLRSKIFGQNLLASQSVVKS